MIACSLLLSVILAGAPPADTGTSPLADSSVAGSIAAATLGVTPLEPAAEADTVHRRRPHAIEVSDSYELRLRIHRYASYATIPLFIAQSVAGNQLYQSGGPTPTWANDLHQAGAAGLGALFTLNTVTGVWNLWETRHDPAGRTKRLVHSALLLASDAGFAYAGIKLGNEAKNSQAARDRHMRIAYASMGTALVGYGVMLFGKH